MLRQCTRDVFCLREEVHVRVAGCRFLGSEVSRRISASPRALTVACLVQQQIRRQVRLEDAAGAVSMDPSAFSRFFKAKTGVTFGHYVRAIKISHAARMLETSDALVSEAAAHFGFSSAATFIRAFKSVTGLTPSEYRKRRLRYLAGGFDDGTARRPRGGVRASRRG